MISQALKQSKPSASQYVADYLRQHIAGKIWRVGEKIPSENTLTHRLGVSRVSVRLAIQQFITLGVLESIHGKGTYLRADDPVILSGNPGTIGPEECRDIVAVLHFRALLEPEACYLAATTADPALLARLEQQLHLLVTHIGSSEEFIKHDIAFHLELSAACGNSLIHKALCATFEGTKRDHARMNDIFGYKDGVYYHSLILKAFKVNDPKLARTLMAEHLDHALKQVDNSQ